jgi:hypothetical protein
MLGEGIIVRAATFHVGRGSAHIMKSLLAAARRLVARLPTALVLAAAAARGWAVWRRLRSAGADRRTTERDTLPSLYDVHPTAGTAPRRAIGLRGVPLDRIVGTMRHPSQNTADFLPLPRLRGTNWHGRWQRITRALDGLAVLPPVDLVQVGDDYYVADGHNRVAAARLAGAGEIDADVTQLIVPGVTRPGQAILDTTSLIGAAEVRQAASGRQSRMVEQRTVTDELMRRDLLRGDEDRG